VLASDPLTPTSKRYGLQTVMVVPSLSSSGSRLPPGV
jgi:hypothetical protein